MDKYKIVLTLLFLVALPLFSQVDIDKVVAKLDSEIAEERTTAINFLGLIKCREAVKPLHDSLKKYKGRDSDCIIKALESIGDSSSILPILTWTVPWYFDEKELDKSLQVIDPHWRTRDEIKTFLKELIDEYRSLPAKEKKSEAYDLLGKIALLNANHNWLISIQFQNEMSAKKSLDKIVYKISVGDPQDHSLVLSLPYTECVYDQEEKLDRVNECWRKQENFQKLIPMIENHLNKLVNKINSTKKIEHKERLLDNCFQMDIWNLKELNPLKANEISKKIQFDQKNEMALRLLCLGEWLKGSGSPDYGILDDFIKKNMPRIAAGDLRYLHYCIDIFVELKDNRVVPLLVQILTNEKKELDKDEADFRINCANDLGELDRDKATPLLKNEVRLLLNKGDLEYGDPNCRYLGIAIQFGVLNDPDLMLALLKKEQSAHYVFEELQRTKPIKALPILRNYVNTQKEYNWEAEKALAQIEGKGALPRLQEIATSLLADQDKNNRRNRRALISIIIKADDLQGAALIWEWLDNFDDRLAENSKEFKNLEVESPEMFQETLQYAQKSNSYLIREMIAALGRWKEKKAIDVIKRYVNDPFPAVRAYAAWAIRQIAE